jgi:predicted dehydrogenase
VAALLRFGIIGTGSIASEFAEALQEAELCVAESVASREESRAIEFAEAHGLPRAAAAQDELLADPDVDVVYVATPHSEHLAGARAALEAGKHVLCEKPLTVDAREAAELVALAERRRLLLLEAFAYRFHPQTTTLLALLGSGAIGRVGAIDVTFSYRTTAGETSRVVSAALAGGGILDVGCYCTSAAQAIVAAALGEGAPEPEEVEGLAVLDERERTDLVAMAVMRFPEDILAELSCGVALAQDDHIRVYGSAGSIHIAEPCWLPGRRRSGSTIELKGAEDRSIEIAPTRHLFALEADGVATMLADGIDAWRGAWADTLANMRTLDRWRRAAGVRYPGE